MCNKNGTIFPKLFIGSASKSFVQFLKKHNYNYNINYISSFDDLVSVINLYSHYKNYTLPVIISDISFLSKKEQSVLLKFMDDTDLNIILLASRDNILDTIISRVKEFRKFYTTNNSISFINVQRAREMLTNDSDISDDLSYDDKLCIYNKYNPIIAYDNFITSHISKNNQAKILNMLEYNNEQ